MRFKWPQPLRFLSAALALAVVSSASAQTTEFWPGWHSRQQNPPLEQLIQDSRDKIAQYSEEEGVPSLLSILEELQKRRDASTDPAFLVAVAQFLQESIGDFANIESVSEILQELLNQIPLPTPIRNQERVMPSVPGEISKGNWPRRQDDWDQVALWPKVFKPLWEIEEGIANNPTFDPLQPKAGAILQSTANRLDQELWKKSRLDLTISGPKEKTLVPRQGDQDLMIAIEKEWDPEEVGYYKTWIYINNDILQSVETSYKGMLHRQQQEPKTRIVQVPMKAWFYSYKTYKEVPVARGEIFCLGHLLPSTSPWNSRGFVWRAFVEDLKVNLYNDMLRYGADECTKEKPCTIYVIIHPRILTEMTLLWDHQAVPHVFPMEELP